jgi:hypothetical protein
MTAVPMTTQAIPIATLIIPPRLGFGFAPPAPTS